MAAGYLLSSSIPAVHFLFSYLLSLPVASLILSHLFVKLSSLRAFGTDVKMGGGRKTGWWCHCGRAWLSGGLTGAFAFLIFF